MVICKEHLLSNDLEPLWNGIPYLGGQVLDDEAAAPHAAPGGAATVAAADGHAEVSRVVIVAQLFFKTSISFTERLSTAIAQPLFFSGMAPS